MLGSGLMALGLALAWWLPAGRTHILKGANFLTGRYGESVVVGPTPSPTADSSEERITNLEAAVKNIEEELAAVKTSLLSNQAQVNAAIAEIGQTNDILEKRQSEWLAALKRVGAVTSNAEAPSSSVEEKEAQSNSGKININTAGEAKLDELPGIGPSYAARIVSYRQEHGAFKSIEDIQNVTGIGEALFAKIKDLIEV